jgi:hypothetical protein
MNLSELIEFIEKKGINSIFDQDMVWQTKYWLEELCKRRLLEAKDKYIAENPLLNQGREIDDIFDPDEEGYKYIVSAANTRAYNPKLDEKIDTFFDELGSSFYTFMKKSITRSKLPDNRNIADQAQPSIKSDE